MCCRRESLGTDSLVLRRVRPFNTSIIAFVAKFFCVAKFDRAGVVVSEKFSARYRCCVEFYRRDKKYDSAETLNSSAFLHDDDFCAENCARGKFFATALRLRRSRASAAKAG
jgi:hypothetical protein